MFNVVLYQPEIPPNTGNIMRLCANTGCVLHLVKPLGFDLDERSLRRAGLDYRDYAKVTVLAGLDEILDSNLRLFAVSTRGAVRHDQVVYLPGDAFIFGPETRGLPPEILRAFPEQRRLRIPMVANSRSLNLSNAVAAVVYEAWRQQGFAGGA